MATENRVKVLEGEFKLIKSEIYQTLSSVRDFMLDLKLPPVQDDANKKVADALAATTQDSDQQAEENEGTGTEEYGDGSGNGNMGEDSAFPEPSPDLSSAGSPEAASQGTPSEGSEPMSESEMDQPLDFIDSDNNPNDEGGISSGDMPGQPKNNRDENGQDTVGPVSLEEVKPTAPPVNLLANLIRWVAAAKKDIGIAQLPVFLDVYASTGNLNTEMKGTILYLAEVATGPEEKLLPEKNRTVSEELTICMEINGLSGQLPEDLKRKVQRLTQIILEQSLNTGKSDVWSQMLLELHGVLSGFGNSLKPYQILQTEDQAAEEKAAAGEAEGEEESHMDLGEDEDYESEESEDDDILCLDERHSRSLNLTKPAKLRLIMPVGDGTEQELDLGNLFIATDKKEKESKLEAKSIISKKKVVLRGKAWL